MLARRERSSSMFMGLAKSRTPFWWSRNSIQSLLSNIFDHLDEKSQLHFNGAETPPRTTETSLPLSQNFISHSNDRDSPKLRFLPFTPPRSCSISSSLFSFALHNVYHANIEFSTVLQKESSFYSLDSIHSNFDQPYLPVKG